MSLESVAGGLCVFIPSALMIWGLYFMWVVLPRQTRAWRNQWALELQSIPDEEFERVFSIIERIGTEHPTAMMLAHTGRLVSEDHCNLIRQPTTLKNFPWGGYCVAVNRPDDAVGDEFSFVESDFQGICLFGESYRAVGVPRMPGKSGKSRNVYSLERLGELAPELMVDRPGTVPLNAQAFVSRILPGREGGQIGGSPLWIQGPEEFRCPECGRRMELIVQLSTRELKHPKGDDEMIYFFGCKKHLDCTCTTGQMY